MSSGKDNNEGFTMFLVFGMIALVIWGIWYAFQEELLSLVRWIRVGELYLISFLTDRYDNFREWLKVADPNRHLPANHPYKLSTDAIGYVSNITGPYLRWPAIILLALMALWAAFFSLTTKYRRWYDLEGLIKTQAITWPVISPIVDFDPSQSSARTPGEPVPEHLPMFAEALSPEEWLAYNRIPMENGMPDKEALRRAYAVQLGKRWRGLEGLEPYILCLLAAFALRGAQKRTDSDIYLGELSVCWNAKTGLALRPELIDKARKIMADPKMGGLALEAANRHAYRTTALLGVLFWAREMGGVLAPASFLWLRGVDRALWYPLNNLGRRTFHAEAAGAMAHYMAERAAKKALPIPRLETAIVTMSQYMARTKARIPILETVEKPPLLPKA